MKVFISWSGEKSKQVGEVIRDWLPNVLQTVDPYFTPSDIEKGTRWSSDIAKELDDSSAGIFCVTKDNMNSQWLMFEAGAISKQVEQSLVCPILIGIDNSDISGPLTQFQSTLFEKSEIKKLIVAINNANSLNPLAESVLDSVFNKWWPDLEEKVQKIIDRDEDCKDENIRSDRDIMEEILDLSRSLAIVKSGGFKNQSKLNGLISDFLTHFDLVFRLDWEHTSLAIEGDFGISKAGNFISPDVEDESNNWGNRAALLASYRSLVHYIDFNNIDISTKFY